MPTELVHRGDVLKVLLFGLNCLSFEESVEVHLILHLLLPLVCLDGWQRPSQLRGPATAIAAINRGVQVPFCPRMLHPLLGAFVVISFWDACCIPFWGAFRRVTVVLNPSVPAGAAGGAHPNGWRGAGGHIICG